MFPTTTEHKGEGVFFENGGRRRIQFSECTWPSAMEMFSNYGLFLLTNIHLLRANLDLAPTVTFTAIPITFRKDKNVESLIVFDQTTS